MARRVRKNFLVNVFQRQLKAMTRTMLQTSLSIGTKALKRSIRVPEHLRKTTLRKPTLMGPKRRKSTAGHANWTTGMALAAVGARRYYVYKPPGVKRTERLPLVVMLHGCDQHAKGFAAITGMNRVAARERFLVLYPEQDRLANPQACWNWYETRHGRAQAEAAIIITAIEQVCLFQPVDRSRIALAGFSAGASMAGLIASRYPERFEAVAMHSGIGIDVAHSSATALKAMLGRGAQSAAVPIALSAALVTRSLPALLVIHGSNDHIVAAVNGAQAALHWAANAGLDRHAGHARVVQRGARYPATLIDWRIDKRLVATLCEVSGLGHAWSGGANAHAYSDPKGPDAARMIWAFAARQFAIAAVMTNQGNQSLAKSGSAQTRSEQRVNVSR